MIQMLRFWVPRSEAVEQALLGSIRFPFSFFNYTKKGERVTSAILDRLSRMTNVDDFSPAEVARLLENAAIRASVETEPDADAKFARAFESAISEEISARH
jgi:hypothetical protein